MCGAILAGLVAERLVGEGGTRVAATNRTRAKAAALRRPGVEAIALEDEPDGKWLQINAEYAKVWPNITVKGTPPEDKEQFERETGKFEKYFSTKPGTGS